jgi:hypothetical protein
MIFRALIAPGTEPELPLWKRRRGLLWRIDLTEIA